MTTEIKKEAHGHTNVRRLFFVLISFSQIICYNTKNL